MIHLTATLALLAQSTGSLTGDAESALNSVNAWLLGISNTFIVSVFVAGVLAALVGHVLGIKILPGANSTMGRVIILSLVAAYAIGHGPAYIGSLM